MLILGDIDTTSINYLKSVVFQGNEDAYYLTENVFAFASSAFIPISQAAKVGNLTFRSGAATVAKEGIAMMAGAGASDITMKISGNQTAGVDEINVIFKDTMGYEPPYKPGTKVTEIESTKKQTYVRVYDKVNSRMQGGWVMEAEDIAGLTPKEIQNKFALPTTPKYICDVELEVGTRLRMGEVNPLFGFEGGGQQYDLIINGKNVGIFTNERIIGQ